MSILQEQEDKTRFSCIIALVRHSTLRTIFPAVAAVGAVHAANDQITGFLFLPTSYCIMFDDGHLADQKL